MGVPELQDMERGAQEEVHHARLQGAPPLPGGKGGKRAGRPVAGTLNQSRQGSGATRTAVAAAGKLGLRSLLISQLCLTSCMQAVPAACTRHLAMEPIPKEAVETAFAAECPRQACLLRGGRQGGGRRRSRN